MFTDRLTEVKINIKFKVGSCNPIAVIKLVLKMELNYCQVFAGHTTTTYIQEINTRGKIKLPHFTVQIKQLGKISNNTYTFTEG